MLDEEQQFTGADSATETDGSASMIADVALNEILEKVQHQLEYVLNF